MKLKKKLAKPKSFEFSYLAGFIQRKAEAWILPDTRGLFCCGQSGPETWSVWHVPTGQSVILAESFEYAAKVAKFVFSKMDLSPLSKVGPCDKLGAVFPDWAAEYIHWVWQSQPDIDEIPTVEKWQNLKSSAKSKSPSNGKKLRAKVKRRN